MIEIKQKEAKPDENGQYRPDQRFPGTVYYHAVPQTLSGKYLTGLDVYSSVITNISDSSERTKKVAEIIAKELINWLGSTFSTMLQSVDN
jgi:hypothetical protein